MFKFSAVKLFCHLKLPQYNLKFLSYYCEKLSPNDCGPENSKQIRVRFAPSPTGKIHLGGIRTLLYNYLFAKQKGGKIILRIEDTDKVREVNNDDLWELSEWLDLKFDESSKNGGKFGPYIQSERKDLYKEYAEKLIQSGHAYRCYCSASRLQDLRQRGKNYDRFCLINHQNSQNDTTLPHTIRLKIPTGATLVDDVVRGKRYIQNETIDDQVLLKSDGFPTYHLANVVDDHEMKITHVIRGEEWIISTAKHNILYEAFGWDKPTYCHLPLLLNSDKSKLSKRHGDVSAIDYKVLILKNREKGFLPEALINFVAFLGWSPSINQREHSENIFTIQDLINSFSLNKVHKSGAEVNFQKLSWLNRQHINRLSNLGNKDKGILRLLKSLKTELTNTNITFNNISDEYLIKMIHISKSRINIIKDIPEKWNYLLIRPTPSTNSPLFAKNWKENSKMLVQDLYQELMELDDKQFDIKNEEYQSNMTEEQIKAYSNKSSMQKIFEKIATNHNVTTGKIFAPVRFLLTDSNIGASAEETIKTLGKDETLKRLQFGLNTF